MCTVIFNSTIEATISAFNKSISVYDNSITNNAFFHLEQYNNDELETLIGIPITSIIIKNDKNEVIYSLPDTNAKIVNLNVRLIDDSVGTDLNLSFLTLDK